MSGQALGSAPPPPAARQTTIGYFVREDYQEECLRFVEELKRRIEGAGGGRERE